MCTLFREVMALGIIRNFKQRCKRVYFDIDTCREFFLRYMDSIAGKFLGKTTRFYGKAHARRMSAIFTQGDVYQIRDAKLPALTGEDAILFWEFIFEGSFGSYVWCNDDYSEETFNFCNACLNEGPYGLMNDKVSATVQPGDIVIDAGIWIGDFAAYASVKGATVYAFEPTDTTFENLKRTAELNGNIIPVKKGLSDEKTHAHFFVNTVGNSGANRIDASSGDFTEAPSGIDTITLDDFVRENNLPRVDFIKADIEGFERHMLAGAQETLARFAPKLALCTYHLPDDPEVMARLILQANPRYNIVQKRCKLFASVL